MMDMSKNIPGGMKDIVPSECEQKLFIKNTLEEIFYSWGYERIITPTLEFYDTFQQYKNSLGQEEMYKFFDNKGRILVLRPDMTVPIARLVSTKFKDKKKPVRLQYYANVFRVNESLGGKRDEYTDCGIELIGKKGFNADIEVILLAIKALEKLRLKNFKLEIGHIGIMNSIFKKLNICDEKRNEIASLIEKKRVVDLQENLESLNLAEKEKEILNKLPWLFGGIELLENVLNMDVSEDVNSEVKYLKEIFNFLKDFGYDKNISFDLGRIPEPDYYTGIIFRAFTDGIGENILSGGRYDKLLSCFGNEEAAVGFSVKVDSLLPLFKNEEKQVVEVYCNNNLKAAILEAESLRSKGERVVLAEEPNIDGKNK